MRVVIALTLLAASCESGSKRAEWSLVIEDTPHSILSCWSAGPDDTLFVGSEGSVRHWDGEALRTLRSGTDEWLWWVWGCARDNAWAVGEAGTILRIRGDAIDAEESGTTAALWGVWGPSCDDVWIAGGSTTGPPTDVVVRDTGSGFAPAGPEPLGLSFFKVWGSAEDDVVVVGSAGVAWRFDGAVWTLQATGCESQLFTVHGGARDDVLAVGQGCAVGYDGSRWAPIPGLDLGGHQPNGVHVSNDGSALIVGFGSTKIRRTPEGEWLDESADDPIGQEFHAACSDGRDGFYAVGGNFAARSAEQRGVIAHWGVDPPAFGP